MEGLKMLDEPALPNSSEKKSKGGPLRFLISCALSESSLCGLAGISFLSIIYFVYGELTGTVHNLGNTALMSVVLFACGILLVNLVALGEYVGKLMNAAYKRPGYVMVEKARPSSAGRDKFNELTA